MIISTILRGAFRHGLYRLQLSVAKFNFCAINKLIIISFKIINKLIIQKYFKFWQLNVKYSNFCFLFYPSTLASISFIFIPKSYKHQILTFTSNTFLTSRTFLLRTFNSSASHLAINLRYQVEMSSANEHVYIYILKQIDLIGCLLFRNFIKQLN